MPCLCGDYRCNCSSRCICFNQNCPCLTCEVVRINQDWPNQLQETPNTSQPRQGNTHGNSPVQSSSFSNAASSQGSEQYLANKEMSRKNQEFSYFRTTDVNIRNSSLNMSQSAGTGTETTSSSSCSIFQKDTVPHTSGSSSSNTSLQRNPGIIEPNKSDGGYLRQLGERGNPTKQKFAAAFKELERRENVGAPVSNITGRDANKVSVTNPSTSQSLALRTRPFDPAMLSASHEQGQMSIPASMFQKCQSLPSLSQELPLNLSKDRSVQGDLGSHPSNYRPRNQNLVTRTLSDTDRSAITSDKATPLSANKESTPIIRKLLTSGSSAQQPYQRFYLNMSTTGNTSASHSSHDTTGGSMNQSTNQSTVENTFSKHMSSSIGQRTSSSEPNLMRLPSLESSSQSFENKVLNTESTTSPERQESLIQKHHPILRGCLSSPSRLREPNVSSNQSNSQFTVENKFSKLNMSSPAERGISSHSESTTSLHPESKGFSQSFGSEPSKDAEKETSSPERKKSLTELNPNLAERLSSPLRYKISNVSTSPSKSPSNDGQIPKDHPALRKCLSSPLQTKLSNTCAASQSSSDPTTVSAPPSQEHQSPRHAQLTRSESEPNRSRELVMPSITESEVLKSSTNSDFDCANSLISFSTRCISEASTSRVGVECPAGSMSEASSQASASSFSAVSLPGPSSVISSESISPTANRPQIAQLESLDSRTVSQRAMRPPFAPARMPNVGQEHRPMRFQTSTITSPVRRPHPRQSSFSGEESPESCKFTSHKRKKSK